MTSKRKLNSRVSLFASFTRVSRLTSWVQALAVLSILCWFIRRYFQIPLFFFIFSSLPNVGFTRVCCAFVVARPPVYEAKKKLRNEESHVKGKRPTTINRCSLVYVRKLPFCASSSAHLFIIRSHNFVSTNDGPLSTGRGECVFFCFTSLPCNNAERRRANGM